jgi:RNA 2',3'-cyclic 3'-phosphodiesterase
VTRAASVEGRERLRLFCALRLSEDILDRLVEWGARHLSERIVTRPNLHITLAFLGNRPVDELDAIVAATGAAAAQAGPMVLEPRRYRETRSVGMLVLSDRNDAAARLADDLFGRLEALGVYEREQRRWLPHLTVVRFRGRPRLDPPLPNLGPFSPSDAAVYLSRLRPGGAQYEVVQSFVLGGG